MGSTSFITFDDHAISLSDALRHLQTAGKLDEVIGTVLKQHLIEQALNAQPDGAVPPDAPDQAIASFRQQNSLLDPTAFQAWLDQEGLDLPTLQQQVLYNLKLTRLKLDVTQPRIQEYFIERKLSLDQVVLSRIAVEDRELAAELKDQLTEGASFEELARDYSLADERFFNGMMGMVSRGELPDALRAAIDTAEPGEIVGPLDFDDVWMVFRLEKRLSASLDHPQVLQILQDELFEQWILQQLQGKEIEISANR